MIKPASGRKVALAYYKGEWLCEVDDIIRRGSLPLHPFPCDPVLNSFEFILYLSLVRSQKNIRGVHVTCREPRSSSSERISITSSSLSSLSRLTPFPLPP